MLFYKHFNNNVEYPIPNNKYKRIYYLIKQFSVCAFTVILNATINTTINKKDFLQRNPNIL